MSRAIGIDLGTTNSCVAAIEGGKPVVIANAEGMRTTPSIVAFKNDGERLIGESAKRQYALNPTRTISSIKRHMGTDYRARIDGKDYSPQEISSIILMKLKKDAEQYLGQPVTDAVITVPAYFSDSQRQATKDAGRIAGLNVLRIINEPTSAALAYGLDNGEPQKIMIYDFGGGTFDVSIIEIGNQVIEVLSTNGDNHLGGDDFDQRLTDYIVKTYKKQERINLEKDFSALQRVREESARAKISLSSAAQTDINLPFITTDKKGEPKHLQMTITRAQFEELTSDLVERTAGPVNTALKDAGIRAADLSKVIMVGGSTRIPAVQNKVKQLTGIEPSKSLNPDECVALGAAVQAEKLSGGAALVEGSSASEIILMDVTPLSLSIETVGGVANVLIPKNSAIPTRKSNIYTTAANFQTSVDVKIYQGERKFTRDNKLLGNFKLSGIKRAPAGVPQIEVTFDIDANGIVNVSAKDLGTGKQQQITITSSSNLSEAEIQKAMADARFYESQDNKRQENIDIRNEAEKLAFQVSQSLKDSKKDMEKTEYKQIKADLNTLQKLLGKTTIEKITDQQAGEIRAARETLERSAAELLS
ncbi:molecular chaperone DnaK [Eubacterium sp. am_0171]|uniref:molecular chaperone DnaK n=1 Tax=unclassified Eubacterium (in: firmicutes) TaxID=2624479 RepID=UPI0010221E04|nr:MULTISPECIES: molecular chaperone DnaK [unclassified Eubacterium (in: firmicutes)]MSC83393.1 molecular chaperone DnaK [Eubacterium sp. BIOML-A1]MSD05269.1 molecular chaperone DnaK [Eubacterium sp. BIOML-A2]RYT24928.1 molecular chaperone DnaK [Eubacterium sp. am_0171]